MNEEIEFYVSSAGLAGDPYKLLVGKKSGVKLIEGFTDSGIFKDWNFKRAKKRLVKRFKLLDSHHIESADVDLFNKIEFKLIKELKEGDLVVVKCKERMSPEQLNRIGDIMKSLKMKSQYLIVPLQVEIDKVLRNEILNNNRNGANEN